MAAPPQALMRPGGFDTDSCLVARLADAGAVLLPFSYSASGDSLDKSHLFHHLAYTTDDAKAGPGNAVGSLTKEIASVHSAWPGTKIIVVGHSYGGLVAELWWEGARALSADHVGVTNVFTLDSPINGTAVGAFAAVGVGRANSSLFGYRWDHQPLTASYILALLAKQMDNSLTLVANANDPTYGDGLLGGGGGLESQAVTYGCGDPDCVKSPPSFKVTDSACDGTAGDLYGTVAHDIVKVCPQVVRLILAAVHADSNNRSPSAAPSASVGGSGSPATTSTSPTALAGGCAAFAYANPSPGVVCAPFGETAVVAGRSVRASALYVSRDSHGSAEVCSDVTDLNTAQFDSIESSAYWALAPTPPGYFGVEQEAFGGTLNDTGYIHPGAAVSGNVCFRNPQTKGPVWLIWSPNGSTVYWGIPNAVTNNLGSG